VHRRSFISTIAAGLFGTMASPAARASQGTPRASEYYVWRQFVLRTGSQPRRLSEFLQQAAVPALNRLGHSPVGVFEVIAGLPSPTVFVLVPGSSLDDLARLDARLQGDEVFMQAGAPYIDAPATDPAYVRQESSLLAAFTKVPRIEVPAGAAAKRPRLFELRIYESASERAHLAKARMFDELGEIEIFRKVGLTPVFFGRTVIGPRMPNFVYMLVHDDMAAREKSWDAFRTSPDWKALAATPGYSDAEIVSNITTIFLRPGAASQV
jgi:hypothetical protein